MPIMWNYAEKVIIMDTPNKCANLQADAFTWMEECIAYALQQAKTDPNPRNWFYYVLNEVCVSKSASSFSMHDIGELISYLFEAVIDDDRLDMPT